VDVVTVPRVRLQNLQASLPSRFRHGTKLKVQKLARAWFATKTEDIFLLAGFFGLELAAAHQATRRRAHARPDPSLGLLRRRGSSSSDSAPRVERRNPINNKTHQCCARSKTAPS